MTCCPHHLFSILPGILRGFFATERKWIENSLTVKQLVRINGKNIFFLFLSEYPPLLSQKSLSFSFYTQICLLHNYLEGRKCGRSAQESPFFAYGVASLRARRQKMSPEKKFILKRSASTHFFPIKMQMVVLYAALWFHTTKIRQKGPFFTANLSSTEKNQGASRGETISLNLSRVDKIFLS